MAERKQVIDTNWSDAEGGNTAVLNGDGAAEREPWDRRPAEADNFTSDRQPAYPEWLQGALNELRLLTQLEPGWDSYEGRPPSPALVLDACAAIQAICLEHAETMRPEISATPKAGIELYWSTTNGNLSILFDSSGHHRLRFTEAGRRAVEREPFMLQDTDTLVAWIRRLDS